MQIKNMTDVSLRMPAEPGRARTVTDVWRDEPFFERLKNFTDLGEPDMAILRSLIETELTVRKRRDIVLDGYEFCKLCFIKDGFAARYKLLRNGKRQIVSFMLPGDVVGLPGSFFDRAAQSVIAATDMTLQVCSFDAFVTMCYRRPKFALMLSWLAVHEAATCAEHIINIGRRTPIERLAHFLLEIHSRLSMVGIAGEFGFDLPFTQEMMSDALGLSVPHLNRTFARLRADGMITMSERRVEFCDIKAMQVLAHFQPLEPARIPLPGQVDMY
jgi:CRP-like cAMP-binding protein